MKEDFVSYDIAVKLKEKGYPQVKKDSLAMYNQDGDWFSLARNLDTFEYLFDDFDDKDCVCPTIFQVLKWLREEKKISIQPLTIRGGTWEAQITFTDDNDVNLKNMFGDKSLWTDDRFTSYEQAAVAGIEYVIDNLI